jgi:hypothetical protein
VGRGLLWFWSKKRGRSPRAYSEAGMSLIEVAVLFVAVGFFVIAAAPLFSRFLQVRTSVDYTLQATVLAQDIMERIRGKSFEELKAKVNAEGWKLNNSDFSEFLYGSEDIPPLPPGAEILLKIQQESNDLLIVEVEIKWKEILRAATPTGSSSPQERSYRVATYVYRHGIHELHGGSE